MSYSLVTKCHICIKQDKCIDRHFIDGAINGIHHIWPNPLEKGHLGSGTIEIKCTNLESVSKPEE